MVSTRCLAHAIPRVGSSGCAEGAPGEIVERSDWVDVASKGSALHHEGVKGIWYENCFGLENLVDYVVDMYFLVG